MTSLRSCTTGMALILATLAGLGATGCRAPQGRHDPNAATGSAPQELDRRQASHNQTADRNASTANSLVPVDANGPMVPYGVDSGRAASWSRTKTSGPRDVILRPGDVVEVKFFYTPELDVSQAVRPDGKIALQLVGEVPIEGLTPGQVRDLLLTLYASHLKDPKITILLKSQYDRRVYVGGEVTKPGVIEMPGDMTATEAIMEAGGFKMDEARVDTVVVIRQTAERWQGYKINLKPTLKGHPTEPFYLHPRDIVFVPRTRISEIDQWIEQHINKLIPRLPFYFTIPNND